MRGHRLRLGENMPGRTPKSAKDSLAEEGHSGCKSQNIEIRDLKDAQKQLAQPSLKVWKAQNSRAAY